jgi:esterase/lipase superfamily enzyme
MTRSPRRPDFLRLTTLLRLATACCLSLALAGCIFNDRGLQSPYAVAREGATPFSDRPTILLATTRKVNDKPDRSPYFTTDRGSGLTFAEVSVEPPPTTIAASLTSIVSSNWAVTNVARRTPAGAADMLASAASGNDVLLYVHGYNETFESAAAGAAELSHGLSFSGRTALFSWPSGGKLIAYAYDRESAMWSRDALEDVLKALTTNPSVGRVHIVAHSMGALLTLETLRQLRAGAGDELALKLGAMVLASPDIDIDQFESTVKRLGPYGQRITVISATNDRALAISSRLAGGIARAGVADRERLAALGVRVADASDYGGGLIRHDLFISDKEVRDVIARAIQRAR